MKGLKDILRYIFVEIRRYIILGMMIILMLFFLSFAEKSVSDSKCGSVTIKIYPEGTIRFVNRQDIKDMLMEVNRNNLIGQKLSDIKFFEIEKHLNNNNYIKESEIYTDLSGRVFVDIYQKEPILRILSVYGANYYLCKDGETIPYSPVFTPKVLVASGYTEASNKYPDIEKKLLMLAEYISKDDFLNVLIGQIYVKLNRQVILIPKVENILVEFGDISDMETKFAKLKVFYKHVLPSQGWNKYNKVDIRFNNQIILNKR